MRIVAVTLACTLAIGSAISVVSAQSSRQNEFVSALPGDGQLLCNEGRMLCVPANMANSLISNPLKITVIVNSTDDIQIDWELDDGGGKLLETVSQYDDYDPQNPVLSPSRAVLVQGFISSPSESARGTLTISPSRYTIGNGTEDLPKLRIPVRLTTATTTITILTPEDPKAFDDAVTTWMDSPTDHGNSEFDPNLRLVPQKVTIMHVEPSAMIGATAEAVLRADPGQGPWHVTDWTRDGDTAHVRIIGDGWAGVSYYLTGVTYLIRKSVVNLPAIKKLVFDPR